MAVRQGQAFILGAVIFAGLFLVAASPAGPSIESGGSSDIRSFFQKSFDTQIDAFNSELAENYSASHVRRKMYVHNRFLEQSSGLKGAGYSSYVFFALPDTEKAVFINYRNSETEISFQNGSEYSKNVSARQWYGFDFDNSQNVTLNVTDLGHSHEIDPYKPTLAFWMRMERDTQSVEGRYTG